ncbi:transcription termination/antitermination protein NusG [Candidatus Mycoplasma pogonae]
MENIEKPKKLFSWYMVSTVSGKEDIVKESLLKRIKSYDLQDYFEEVKIFKTPYISPRDLEKKRAGEKFNIKMINVYKGYIFIRMLMNDDAWFLVRNTQYVTGLVGSSGKGAKPTPISDSKMQKMFVNEQKMSQEFENNKEKSGFEKGQFVQIINGPFLNEIGQIIENNDIQKYAVVELEIFGKKTPTQLEHAVLKIKD